MAEDLETGEALYCRFVLADQDFAVPAVTVKEVLTMTNCTPIPGTPPGVAGYVNLRGQLHVVLDPRPFLSRQPPDSARGFLIVFQPHVAESFAIRIDQLTDMVPVRNSQINYPKPAGELPSGELEHLITGHARLEDTMVTLLDPAALYDHCLPAETASLQDGDISTRTAPLN
jgi:purine-binding chemotaxis protein CheW